MEEKSLIEQTEESARTFLKTFFTQENPKEKDIKRAAIAQRYVQTTVDAFKALTSRESVRFRMATVISEDKEELVNYLKKTLPGNGLATELKKAKND